MAPSQMTQIRAAWAKRLRKEGDAHKADATDTLQCCKAAAGRTEIVA